jgi:hypothetical protein
MSRLTFLLFYGNFFFDLSGFSFLNFVSFLKNKSFWSISTATCQVFFEMGGVVEENNGTDESGSR